MRMPAWFVAHGAPTLALQRSGYTEFLRGLAGELPAVPRAIVLLSAHWESAVQQVGSAVRNDTMHDFYGFPEQLYRLRYPAPGDVTLSLTVQQLLREEGIPCEANDVRGLDHGAWAPLLLMFPRADVPVVAMSVHPGLAAEEQYRIGRALSPLRKQGVLIVGSGGIVHNLGRLDWEAEAVAGGGEHAEAGGRQGDGASTGVGAGGSGAAGWAVAFDDWIDEQLETWNTEALFDYEQRGPYAREAVPTREHFVPLLLAMGAADGEREARLLFREYQFGSLSLACWQFGSAGEEGTEGGADDE